MVKPPFPPFSQDVINNIAEQAGKLLPGEKSREELHRSVMLVVQNTLAKLDLVTREEFDAQASVLQKTRAKVDALEKQLATLIDELDQEQDGDTSEEAESKS
ncbi:putative protein YqiC [BD1-7 clade bacterium]|uniref:Ubiquinone biosynthesis accessory factor UbiK n=1 Tax=BD1-7 clade bacterium TaxID=2029982 RepID=A0A5S9N1F2_9GAMM|nr:putative protein YqiC [BD1-7 clade bacterium]CAA0083258.1 putative protein YqiC [BD1-7 clade bacterium]